MNQNTQTNQENKPATTKIRGKQEQTADKSFFGVSQRKKEILKNLGKR